ncbi:MAG: outer membrane lipoprotein chaperone LolA [Proteobacteria bacterium]|jgi:outer membrane lipoprotein carrier protein|nr:outer membrane lipoprotein chaperone LolA [Pseudomonadota bacterium]MBT5065096.1 outer membrane lipoprotein chaperone LolA [Pseudomonadota bacterium]MBT6193264.1 outer membrane lipoprotein chaperone LolA [Pseudomonadota bacterium]MBT6465147.1 outer membrane lipoprotein chaperone LolA [Pseudomonadota bacterium]MBT6674524.1 outer membrane lipoprotein chaperone LolA [Pseudomonadota bacterium]
MIKDYFCRFVAVSVMFFWFLVCPVSSDELPVVTYLRGLEFFSSEFQEQRFSPDGAMVSSSQGKCRIHRPRKLYWEYSQPARQVIISDGETLWIYEPELEQVIKSSISTMASSALSPLLESRERIDKLYTFEARSDLNWWRLRPVSVAKYSEAAKIDIKFMDGKIDQIKLTDPLGFVTKLFFTKIHYKAVKAAVFDFSPPDNIDVVNAGFNENRDDLD